jgi:hypothetical protein
MEIIFSKSTKIDDFSQALNTISDNEKINSIIVFACDENNYADNLTQIDEVLKSCQKPIIGGIFPQIVYNKNSYNQGFLIVGINNKITTFITHKLSDTNENYEEVLDSLIPEDVEFKTMIIMADGLSSRIGSWTESLYAIFGPSISYIGGGAGSLSFVQKPCILSNQGLFADSAIIALFDDELATKVGHGWQEFDTNHIVTLVDKNIVKEIDYKNALEVYERAIKPDSKINPENFFSIAKSFPLGIKRIDGGYIVRDPISITGDGHLVCVGELSQGDSIDILTSNKDTLIKSASVVGEKLSKEQQDIKAIFLIDCISRALFLEDDFDKELSAIKNNFADTIPMFGALVLGEISNSGSGYLEFYNKTTVVSSL